MGGYAVEMDLIHRMAGWLCGDDNGVSKQNVDGLLVQRSDVKSVKCGESIPQLACETVSSTYIKRQNRNSNGNLKWLRWVSVSVPVAWTFS